MNMQQSPYAQLREFSLKVASGLSKPAFYATFGQELQKSDHVLRTHELVRQCRAQLNEALLECAHGVCHCEAVARDAGALVLIEGRSRGKEGPETDRLSHAAIMAGLFHDIKRKEADHAVRGSIEAEKILAGLGVGERVRGYITYAIRNHEAFKAVCDLGDEAGCLVSDALYDADKFRWGPENFTTTLWLMVESNNTPPEALHRVFKEKMKGIERIKETFRTETGRRYGPEIIDQGISIGNAIYREMSAMLQRRG
jgi:hypothetical protein